MKKIMGILLIALALIELTSCKKTNLFNYQVECEFNNYRTVDYFTNRKQARAFKKWEEVKPMYNPDDETIIIENDTKCKISMVDN